MYSICALLRSCDDWCVLCGCWLVVVIRLVRDVRSNLSVDVRVFCVCCFWLFVGRCLLVVGC